MGPSPRGVEPPQFSFCADLEINQGIQSARDILRTRMAPAPGAMGWWSQGRSQCPQGRALGKLGNWRCVPILRQVASAGGLFHWPFTFQPPRPSGSIPVDGTAGDQLGASASAMLKAPWRLSAQPPQPNYRPARDHHGRLPSLARMPAWRDRKDLLGNSSRKGSAGRYSPAAVVAVSPDVVSGN
jgi:hypothetical protein